MKFLTKWTPQKRHPPIRHDWFEFAPRGCIDYLHASGCIETPPRQMGNCGLCHLLGRQNPDKCEDAVFQSSHRSTRANTPISEGDKNSYGRCDSIVPVNSPGMKSKKRKEELRQPGKQATPLQQSPMPIRLRDMALSITKSGTLFKALKNCLPSTSMKKNIIKLKRQCPNAMPYVYSAALGFARLNQTWMRFKPAKRPHVRGSSTRYEAGDRQGVQGIPPERENWWRYTMYLPVDPVSKKMDPHELTTNGGKLVSVEGHTGCEIRIGENKFLFRGKEVRHVFIDGPTKNAVICCQRALPENLQKHLILDHENQFSKEPNLRDRKQTSRQTTPPFMKESKLPTLERIGGIETPWNLPLSINA